MDNEEKLEILNSFPLIYAEEELEIIVPKAGFAIFDRGIFAQSMDEKWNVFVVDDVLLFIRSWTGFCIYKVFCQRNNNVTVLHKVHINRDKEQFKSDNTERDVDTLKMLLQMYLKREDLYIDPKFELELIKKTIEQIDPDDEWIKSFGSNSVALIIRIQTALLNAPDNQWTVIGWNELLTKLSEKKNDEPLISLYMKHRDYGRTKTLYFDQNATELLGETVAINNHRYI